MCKSQLYLLVLYIFTCYYRVTEAGKNAGPVKNIEVYRVTECEPELDTDLSKKASFFTELKDLGEGKKAFSGKVTIPFDLDDEISYKIVLKKWTDAGWQDNAYKYDGQKLAQEVKKYIPKFYEKLRKATSPEVEGFPVPAGTYEVKDMQALAKDIEIPSILYGRFMVHITATKDNEIFMCKEIEANSQP